jgi:hypothetical protein
MTDGVPTTLVQKRSRWQFSLRAMFLLTLSAAALAAIARVAAQLDIFVVGVAAAVWSTRGAVTARRRARRLSVRSWMALALSWCAFYVVSVGPAIVVANRFLWTVAPLTTIYAPMSWLYDQQLDGVLWWYVEFWYGLN